jgi:hypothetical protein
MKTARSVKPCGNGSHQVVQPTLRVLCPLAGAAEHPRLHLVDALILQFPRHHVAVTRAARGRLPLDVDAIRAPLRLAHEDA